MKPLLALFLTAATAADLTLLSGANGVGKTNIYRALRLVSSMARGGFAEAVAGEGGMRSLLWTDNMNHARLTTILAQVESEAFSYAFECGLMPAAPGDPTKFKLAPDIETEELRYGRRLLAKRTQNQVRVADTKGIMRSFSEPPAVSESMITLVRDLQSCPQILNARLSLERWRFYHAMRTNADAPSRKPVRGYWSPVLNEDASNLPAVIQSINESDLAGAFYEAKAKAFPDSRLEVECGDWFNLAFNAHALPRPLHGHELSDETLQFICLAAVLCSPQPPPLLVLNEPETSLNESVLPALADLIATASEHSQIILVSHSQALCEAAAARCQVKMRPLTIRLGETRLVGQEHARTVFVCDDEEEEAE